MYRQILAEIDTARARMRELAELESLDESQTSEFESLRTTIDSLETRHRRAVEVDEIDRRAAGRAVVETRGDARWEDQVRGVSILRAIAGQVPGLNVDSGREREVSQELQARSGRSSDGVVLPYELFHVEQRAASQISTTVPSGGPGGNLIETSLLAGQFIDLLRSNIMTVGLGARMISGLVGNVEIPRQSGHATATWVAEDGDLTMTAVTTDKISLTPKHVGALTELSRNMLIQTTPDMESLVRADFAAVLARAIDAGAVQGPGSGNAPRGVITTSGITKLATAGTNSAAALDWDDILNLVQAVELEDSMVSGFLTNPRVIRKLRSTLKSSTDTASNFIVNEPGRLAGYPVRTSTAVRDNFKKGTRTTGRASGLNLSTLIAGQWSDLLIGTWAGFEVLANPYAESAYKKGAVQVRAMATMDVAVRHTESFAFFEDVDTA